MWLKITVVSVALHNREQKPSARAVKKSCLRINVLSPLYALTLNHLPKTSPIWRASLRFSEMLRKIMAVCCGAWIASDDRLRAEGEVSDFSRSEPRKGSRVPAGVGMQSLRLHSAAEGRWCGVCTVGLPPV